jgi:nucleoside phosphorylase
MEIIVVAHKKEAHSFIEQLQLRTNEKYPSFIYSNEKTILLVCGQGIENVKIKLSHFFNIFTGNISRIINCGIAGRLNDSINLFEVYTIKAAFLYTDKISNKQYSLENSNGSRNCITALKPVSDQNSANDLSTVAEVVDMELWAIADITSSYKLPLSAFKLISDDARYPVSLNEIKSKAQQFSEQLFEYYTVSINKGQDIDVV